MAGLLVSTLSLIKGKHYKFTLEVAFLKELDEGSRNINTSFSSVTQ